MADPKHASLVAGGSEGWNAWRKQNPTVRPELTGADLSMATARSGASSRALLCSGLGGGVHDLSGFDLHDADLRRANLSGQILAGANLKGADLSGADLTHAHLVRVDLGRAILNGCRVFGISTWDVDLTEAKQVDLIITTEDEPTITVDNLKVAQFIYLLLNNEEIRGIIDTITSKVVLILGRFKSDRKAVLDSLRAVLKEKGYSPILFDFDKPRSRDLTETISTLAHMARFIIADITEAKSIPQELQAIVPNLPSVPVQPIIHESDRPYGMFEHFKRYPWVLSEYYYNDQSQLIQSLPGAVIGPAEAKVAELRG